MILKTLSLQNFRSYNKKEFDFSPQTTIVIGPNAIGKSNLLEAIYLLSTGKSFRTDKDSQLIQFGESLARAKGITDDSTDLEVVLSENPTKFLQKKYLINGVSKRRADFSGKLPVVIFTPLDLDIVAGQPGARRRFLDEVLEQIDEEYRHAHITFTKALRQRNALLELVQETGARDKERFSYWDDLLITNGQLLTKKREELISYINNRKKELFDSALIYDKSIISEERLRQYKTAEVGAGVTLVGPHRDDILIKAVNKASKTEQEVRFFGSRGQQRLVALELKLSQIAIIEERGESQPILLLDDVFSELDSGNIDRILRLMDKYQTIMTTTHKEFVGKKEIKNLKMIELGI